MIKTFSQRLTPPYSGLVQIAESDTYRALTLDANVWEIQYVNRSHVRVGTVTRSDIKTRSIASEQQSEDLADPKLIELLDFLGDVELPFKAQDHFEYWLLDDKTKAPLALLFSCKQAEQMSKFPSRASWTALPDSLMPIIKTQAEIDAGNPPVNYRFESLVAERAGINSRASWFDRHTDHDTLFPQCLVSEVWESDEQQSLCTRYIERQAPRLLMLQGLDQKKRQALESCCTPHALEVARFSELYPEVIDVEMINALRVEARLREASGETANTRIRLN